MSGRPEVVLAAAARTPMGAFQGALAPLKASQIGAAAVAAAVERAGLASDGVDLVVMGNVLPAGMGQAPARQAAIYGGLDRSTPAVTLNKMCGSGLEAVIQAARAVALGDAGVAVAGGMESMTNAPYLLPGARGGLRINDGVVVDSMVHDGLRDAYNDLHMGNCAEMCAREYDFSREQQDAFAAESYRRALAAMEGGRFGDEIVPVEVPGRRGAIVVSEDEGPAKVDFDKIPTLRPVFEAGGTVTAANASTINDGAAALVVTTRERAEADGIEPLARIVGTSGHAQEPEWFTTAPIGAMEALYRKLDWTPEGVDLYEINEAYSVVTMAAMERFALPHERVNVNGGAVALGHPIGASGARILTTLLYALRARGGGRGMASICLGGGEALAMGVETL